MTRRLELFFSVAPTAVLLFVSSSLSLYLRNQEELHRQSAVLWPFLALAGLTWALGFSLLSLASGSPFRYLAWGYLLFGPFLLAFRFLSSVAESGRTLSALAASWLVATEVGLSLWVAGGLLATLLAARRAPPTALARPMALFGVLLLAGETLSFVTGTTSSASGRAYAPPTGGGASAVAASERPNVYHVVLDALTTDAFELGRSPELDARLSGFVYFPANEAIYHGTLMSLASTFASRRYGYDRDRMEFVEESFGDGSFVSELRSAGFGALAVVPVSDPLDPLDPEPFDAVVRHADNFERALATNASAFRDLWVVASLPAPLLERLLRSDRLDSATRSELRLTMQGRALTDSAPVASLWSFRELAEKEELDHAANRYVFVHLLLPHSPYVLGPDCSYGGGERATDPLDQTECTLLLLGEYLDRLSATKRFEDALVVVHGDHGEPFRRRDNELVRSRSRSLRTPLFVKPPGRKRKGPLVDCDAETSLLDVAPTILDFLDLATERGHEGSSLAESIERCVENGDA